MDEPVCQLEFLAALVRIWQWRTAYSAARKLQKITSRSVLEGVWIHCAVSHIHRSLADIDNPGIDQRAQETYRLMGLLEP